MYTDVRTIVALSLSGCIIASVSSQDCPYWSYWSSWSQCTATCGSGTYSRSRKCINGEAGSEGCEGAGEETVDCNTQVWT